MSFLTREALLPQVLAELVLVSGSSVQTYTEPQILQYVQTGFDHFFKKRFWDHLTSTTFHTLDGTAGVVTDIIDTIAEFSDIKWIRAYPYEEDDTLEHFRDGIFPDDRLAFTSFAYGHTHFTNKVVQFNPVTSTASIAIRARRHPGTFGANDIVPFDHLTLMHFVAASMLAIDGMNPDEQARQEGLFNDRYETLVMNEGQHGIFSTKSRWASEFTVAGT